MKIDRTCELWLEQFGKDRQLAQQLITAFRFVSAADFASGLVSTIKSSLPASEASALFVEREIPKDRNRNPRRMYKEDKLKLARGKPTRLRATGAALLAVSSMRLDSQDIGSEGIVATMLTGIARSEKKRFLIQPSANNIRKSKVRNIVVVTDFIGSGDRLSSFLTSIWSVKSVRSWASTGLVKFWVIAYSATELGRHVVESHPTSPTIGLAMACPTIGNNFLAGTREDIEELCQRRSPVRKDPLGYKSIGALIAFAHSCPNNVPAVFHKHSMRKRTPWSPLFPSRVVPHLFGAIAGPLRSPLNLALETLGAGVIASKSAFIRSSVSQKRMIVLLEALRRGRRHIDSISSVTGLTLQEIIEAEQTAIARSLLDGKRRLTKGSFDLLHKLRLPPRKKSTSSPTVAPTKASYYPSQLRAPI